MATNIEHTLIEKVRALPPAKQRELLGIVETLEREALHDGASDQEDRRPIWEVIEEISSQAPPETWDEVPTDGSINVDHYLYGAPKREP